LFVASVCFGRPKKTATSIPPAATTAINKIAKAAAASDYAALETLMERAVVVDAGADPTSAGAVIAQWRAGSPPLSEVSKTIHAGCELVKDPQQVVCPGHKAAEGSDPEAGVYSISLRRARDGSWLIFIATYVD
jgi:hypothetical protein